MNKDNEDNIRKYISDIQIAMGKILQEMDGFKDTSSKLKNHNNLDEETEALTGELGISKEETSTITDILNNTKPKPPAPEETEEDALKRIQTECGL